ncbi:MAG: hypothetical protein Q8N03_07395 [Ignavibacteria bacterium]|nr:hypothetical protein [Ignavibacteria bacterium]MDP3832239.1 hypothetical protein [Ignavibacteriaceae bacterium]
MKNKILTLLFILSFIPVYAQYDFRGSMGINMVNTPFLRDYLQENYAQGEEVNSFSSAVEFGLEAGYEMEKYQIGIEYAFEMSSFNYAFITGKYNFDYGVTSPSIMGYYLIKGEGYKFKFGGGVGPRLLSVDETKPPLSQAVNYKTTGFGVVLRADGTTALGGNFYAYIGFDLRYNLIGKPENNGQTIIMNAAKEELKMNSLSAGIKLGIAAIF